jgi:hypothetical protein
MSAVDHLRRAGAGAAKYARMTAQDIAEVGAVFAQVARRQYRDATRGSGSGGGGLLGRSLRRARRSGAARK